MYANRMQMVCWFWTPLAMLSESLVYVMWFSMWPSRSKLTGFGAYCGSSSGFMNPGLTLSSCILRMASEADSRCYVRISGVTAAVLPFMGFDQHERLPATENVDWNRLNHKTTSLLDMQSMDPSLAVRRRQNASSYVLKITGDTKRCVWKSLGFFSCGKWSTKQWVFHIYILLQAGQVAGYIDWWRQLGSHGWQYVPSIGYWWYWLILALGFPFGYFLCWDLIRYRMVYTALICFAVPLVYVTLRYFKSVSVSVGGSLEEPILENPLHRSFQWFWTITPNNQSTTLW